MESCAGFLDGNVICRVQGHHRVPRSESGRWESPGQMWQWQQGREWCTWNTGAMRPGGQVASEVVGG